MLILLGVVGCGDGPSTPRDAGQDAAVIEDPTVFCADGYDAGVTYDELPDVTTDNLRHSVSVALARNVIMPALRELEVSMRALVCATLASADAPDDIALRMAAQQQWRATMDVIQRANAMEVGPAGNPGVVAGGVGYYDEVYGWPLVNRCKMDELTFGRGYEDVQALRAESINARTLAGMEHLLFGPTATNECPPTSLINTANRWSALPEAEKLARRARYAHNAALIALAQTTALRNAWEPSGGNYYANFTSPGGDNVYPDAQQLLNALSDALFYVYSETRDMKVAHPAGINSIDGVLPDAVESAESDTSLAHIRANIVAFRQLFTGGEPGSTALGFDDLLVSIGQAQLATDMIAAADNALLAADAVTGPLEDAVVSNPAQVQALYDALKVISDFLKTQFISVLGLQAPMGAAGDND